MQSFSSLRYQRHFKDILAWSLGIKQGLLFLFPTNAGPNREQSEGSLNTAQVCAAHNAVGGVDRSCKAELLAPQMVWSMGGCCCNSILSLSLCVCVWHIFYLFWDTFLYDNVLCVVCSERMLVCIENTQV